MTKQNNLNINNVGSISAHIREEGGNVIFDENLNMNSNHIISPDDLDITIGGTKAMTIKSDAVDFHVSKNTTEDVLHTGDLIMRNSKIYFNDSLNTTNYITYKASNILDITAATEIELNTPLITTNNDLLIGGGLTVKKEGEAILTLNDTRTSGASSSIILMRGLTLEDNSVDIYLKNGPDFKIMSSFESTDRDLAIFRWNTGNCDILGSVNSSGINSKSNVSLFDNTTEKIKMYYNSDSVANYIQSLDSTQLIMDYNSSERIRINGAGVELGGTTLTLNSNIIKKGSSDLKLSTNNNVRMVLESGGDVVVGNSSQFGSGEKLTVLGSIKCDNVYTNQGVVDNGAVTLGNTHDIKITGNTTLYVTDSSFKYKDNHYVLILNESSTDSILTIDCLGVSATADLNISINDTTEINENGTSYDYTFKKHSEASLWFIDNTSFVNIRIRSV